MLKYKIRKKLKLKSSFNIYDYTDGEISNDKATVEYDKNIFKTEGIKTITVTAKDKDNNTLFAGTDRCSRSSNPLRVCWEARHCCSV